MSRVGVDQDHQIICKPRILDVGVLAEARGLFRPLQHAINLGEVEIAEQWRDDPALRNATLTIGFEHDLQQAHHVCIIHPSCHLGQQTIMSNVVKIAAQVDVYDACLLLNNRSGYPVDRFMSCPLGTISKRSRLEVCLEDRLQHELERTLHHSISDRRNSKRTRTLPPSFGISCRRWSEKLLGAGMPAHVAKHLSVMTELNKQGRYDRMTDDLFKLTGQKPISMYDFVKLHAAEFTKPEIKT